MSSKKFGITSTLAPVAIAAGFLFNVSLTPAAMACERSAFAASPTHGAMDEPRAWLGVMLDGDNSGSGVRLVDVVQGSAAEKAGLLAGDVVISVDGRAVKQSGELSAAVSARQPGDSVRLEIRRGEDVIEKTAVLGDGRDAGAMARMPFPHGLMGHGGFPAFPPGFAGGMNSKVRLGVTLQDLTPGLRAFFKAGSDEGVLVSEVADGSPAARAGLKAGDVILAIDSRPVADSQQLREAVGSLEAGSRSLLRVLRDGSIQSVEVTVEERKSEAGSGCPSTCPKAACASKPRTRSAGHGAHGAHTMAGKENSEKALLRALGNDGI